MNIGETPETLSLERINLDKTEFEAAVKAAQEKLDQDITKAEEAKGTSFGMVRITTLLTNMMFASEIKKQLFGE